MDEGKVSLGDGRASKAWLGAGGEIGFYGSGRKDDAAFRRGVVRRAGALRRSIGGHHLMLLALSAVALVVSGAAAAMLGSEPATLVPEGPPDGARTTYGPGYNQGGPPGPPCLLFGYVRYMSIPVAGATVTLLDQTTGETLPPYVTGSDGFYMFQLADLPSGYRTGDVILVTAEKTIEELIGSGSYTITGTEPGYAQLDINMVLIPEFSTLIIPVVGMVAVVAAVRLVRGRRDEPRNG